MTLSLKFKKEHIETAIKDCDFAGMEFADLEKTAVELSQDWLLLHAELVVLGPNLPKEIFAKGDIRLILQIPG
jgi:hypothetical protein